MKVVLSHPYSGALYWWLAAQSGVGGSQQEKRPSHSYYRTLYGNVDRNLDIALACCVVFEEVVLPGADVPYPQFDRLSDEEMRLAALELFSSWEPIHEAHQLLRPHEEELLRDPIIHSVLKTVPVDSQRMALLYAVADVLLTQAHAAPVLCTTGRRRIVLRLIELGIVEVPAQVAGAVRDSHGLIDGLEGYFALPGLTFTSSTIDQLATVKWHEKIRSYAESFQNALPSGTGDGFDPLLEKIAEAWSASEVATEIGGAFSTTSRSLGPLGLVPGVGAVAGAGAMAADGASALAQHRAERLHWYELSPEIVRIESLRDLETELRRLGLR
jgi:hypothetical protein